MVFRPDPNQLERVIRVVQDCPAGQEATRSLKAGIFQQQIQMFRLSCKPAGRRRKGPGRWQRHFVSM